MQGENCCILQPIDPLNISFSEDKCVRSPQTYDKSASSKKNDFLDYQHINIVRDPSQLFDIERKPKKIIYQQKHQSQIDRIDFKFNEKYVTTSKLMRINQNLPEMSPIKRKRTSSMRSIRGSENYYKNSQYSNTHRQTYVRNNKNIGIFQIDATIYRNALQDKIKLSKIPTNYLRNSYNHHNLRIMKQNKRLAANEVGSHINKNFHDIKTIDNLINKINSRIFLSKKIIP